MLLRKRPWESAAATASVRGVFIDRYVNEDVESRRRSGDGGGGAVEVGADFAAKGGAVTSGDASFVVDDGQSGVLHQVHASSDRSAGGAEGQVGLTQAVQACLLYTSPSPRD